MLKNEIKKLPQSRLEIGVTVSWDEWEKFIVPAAEELTKDLKIPGFRPGKAPLKMAEQKVGKERIIEKAAEMAIEKTYPKVYAEQKIETLGSPQAEIVKSEEGKDLEYKVVTAIVPTIELKEWRGAIKKINAKFPSEVSEVEEAEVQKELEKLGASRAKLITVNRAAQDGDSLIIDFEVTLDGVNIENGTSRNHPIILGKGVFIPGFEEQLIGMKEQEEKEFELSFPADYHAKHLSGKKAKFKAKVNLVQERQLPALDDEFARSLGKFDDLEALKKNIREGMLEEKKMKQKEKRRALFVEELIGLSEIDLPGVLTHQELHKMIDEFATEIQSMGMTIDMYLEKIGKSLDELEKAWEPQAQKRVKAALIIEKLAKDEEVDIPAEEIEAEMNRTLQFYKNVKNVEKDIDMGRLYSYTKGVLQNDKVFGMLEKI